MIGYTDPPKEFIDRIASWFCASFADPYDNPRMAKSIGLYHLASMVTEGVIVELGTLHGNGAVALASGAHGRKVYTIDDYADRVDWVGNVSGRADKALMKLNVEESGLPIIWINQSAQKAVWSWHEPIGLLFWDTGGNSLHDDFVLWRKHLVSGGLFVMHDTDDRVFHSDEVTREAYEMYWQAGPEFRTLYTVVKP